MSLSALTLLQYVVTESVAVCTVYNTRWWSCYSIYRVEWALNSLVFPLYQENNSRSVRYTHQTHSGRLRMCRKRLCYFPRLYFKSELSMERHGLKRYFIQLLGLSHCIIFHSQATGFQYYRCFYSFVKQRNRINWNKCHI